MNVLIKGLQLLPNLDNVQRKKYLLIYYNEQYDMRRHSRARRRHLEVTIIMAKRHLTIKNYFQPKSPKLVIGLVDDDNGEDRQPSTMLTCHGL